MQAKQSLTPEVLGRPVHGRNLGSSQAASTTLRGSTQAESTTLGQVLGGEPTLLFFLRHLG